MVDILILNYVDFETTQNLVDKVKTYESVDHICIVDNSSPNDSFSQLLPNSCDKISVIRTPKNGGYGYGNNYGIKFLRENYQSKYILVCNPDVIIEDDVIEKLEDFLEKNKSYIIAAPFMCDPQGNKQQNTAFRIGTLQSYILSYGLIYSKIFKPGIYPQITQVDCQKLDVEATAGSLFLLNAELMTSDNLFDENIFLYCEERVLGMRCKKAGLKMALLPRERFIHNHSSSISKVLETEVKKRKVMNSSALYVMKEYYGANKLEIMLAKLLMFISIREIKAVDLIKRKWRCK